MVLELLELVLSLSLSYLSAVGVCLSTRVYFPRQAQILHLALLGAPGASSRALRCSWELLDSGLVGPPWELFGKCLTFLWSS